MKMITKSWNEFSSVDFDSGEVILLDKEAGYTSFDVVNKIRKNLRVKKVGHAGTLDPQATGLLIVCTGKMTKEIFRYQDLMKTYTGTITLGKTTYSMDGETDVIEERSWDGISIKDIEMVRSQFVGTTMQLPPMYSALKHKGKPLYRYARKGQEVQREKREIMISKFEISDYNLPDIDFKIICSKGTYIRVIAHDFGEKLGCGAYLKNLRRTAIGDYKVVDAIRVDELINMLADDNLMPHKTHSRFA